MKGSKGQTLVIFVVLIPIILLILGFVVDYGMLAIEKRKIDNNVYSAMKDIVENNVTLEDTEKLLKQNLTDSQISVSGNDIFVKISATKTYDGILFVKNETINISYNASKETRRINKG